MGESAYCFGEFRLEPSERRLVGPDGAIALPPKTFDLLVILAANAGRLLKKDDLMNRLWPGVFVEEVNLAQNVSALRRALGGEKKTFVETVPRRRLQVRRRRCGRRPRIGRLRTRRDAAAPPDRAALPPP